MRLKKRIMNDGVDHLHVLLRKMEKDKNLMAKPQIIKEQEQEFVRLNGHQI